MRRYCGVRGCGNKTLRSGDSSVSFHHLPKQPDIAKVWLLAMDNPKYPCDLVLSAGTSKYRNVLVCSAHFESFDFHNADGPSASTQRPQRKLLKQGEVVMADCFGKKPPDQVILHSTGTTVPWYWQMPGMLVLLLANVFWFRGFTSKFVFLCFKNFPCKLRSV